MKKLILSIVFVMVSITSFGQDFTAYSDSMFVETPATEFTVGVLGGATMEGVNRQTYVHGRTMIGGYLETKNCYLDVLGISEYGDHSSRANGYSYLFHVGYGVNVNDYFTITPLIGLEQNHTDDTNEKYYFDPGLRTAFKFHIYDSLGGNLSFTYTSVGYYIGFGITFK